MVALGWADAYGAAAAAAGLEKKLGFALLVEAGAAHGFPPEMELLAARDCGCGCCCDCDDPYAGGFEEAKDIALLLLAEKNEDDDPPTPADAGAACCCWYELVLEELPPRLSEAKASIPDAEDGVGAEGALMVEPLPKSDMMSAVFFRAPVLFAMLLLPADDAGALKSRSNRPPPFT